MERREKEKEGKVQSQGGKGKGKELSISPTTTEGCVGDVPEGPVKPPWLLAPQTNDSFDIQVALRQAQEAVVRKTQERQLHKWEEHEMERFGIQDAFKPTAEEKVEAERQMDPELRASIAERKVLRAKEDARSMARFGRPARVHRQHAGRWGDNVNFSKMLEDTARRVRMRRRLLYDRLRAEAEAKGRVPIDIPSELVNVRLDEVQASEQTHCVPSEEENLNPPPAPKLSNRLPAPVTPEYCISSLSSPSDAQDEASLDTGFA